MGCIERVSLRGVKFETESDVGATRVLRGTQGGRVGGYCSQGHCPVTHTVMVVAIAG